MPISVWLYGVILTVLATVLTAVARWSAPRLNYVDRPDAVRKLQRQPVPLLGGIAVFATLCLGWLGLGMESLVPPGWGQPSLHGWLWLLTAGAFCGLGMWDDRFPLRPHQKFLGQLLLCLPYAGMYGNLEEVVVAGQAFDLGYLGVCFSLFWLVACVNAFNLLDGLDGLAAGTGTVLLSTLSAWAYCLGCHDVAWCAGLTVCGLLGFLAHNRPPARIYLGDAGSLFVGFMVGVLSLEVSTQHHSCELTWPLVLLSLPFADTTLAVTRRVLNGRGIGDADREHVHHVLLSQGHKTPRALLILLSISLMQASWASWGWSNAAGLFPLLPSLVSLVGLAHARLLGHREFALCCQRIKQSLLVARVWLPSRINPRQWLAF